MRGHSFLSPVAMLSRRARLLLLGLLLLALVLLFVVSPKLAPLLPQNVPLLDFVAGSVQKAATPFRAVSAKLERFSSLRDIEEKHRLLSQDYESLLFLHDYAKLLEEENRKLRDMLQYRVDVSDIFTKREVGRVLTRTRGAFAHNVIVNVGRRQGIIPGSLALSRGVLVGVVTSVGARSARVRLLRDPQSRVAVKLKESGQRALLAGQGMDNLALLFSQGSEPFAARALVVTSGDAGLLPPEILIGHVVRSTDNRLEVALNRDPDVLTTVDVIAYKPFLDTP